MRAPQCTAIGCRALLLHTELFCGKHVRMIESDTLRVLQRVHRPGRPPSKVFRETLNRAIAEVLAFQHDGHGVPKPQNFEFDDENTEALHGR